MSDVRGFLRADGERLSNDGGRDILLRGVGLGGWLLPEGYMWRLPAPVDRPRRIERMVRQLIGEEKSKEFWDTYHERYVSEEDIRRISCEGFNSVRVPITSRFLIEEDEPIRPIERHWRLLDRLIGWCGAHRLYAILDLHAAPGGQTGANIDDSERDQPELFTNPRNARLAVALWRMLARRYCSEQAVAGYDLLNEPLSPRFPALNGEIMPMYQRIVKAIREVDDRHIIILEGAQWATDWSVFTEKIDDNLMLQFHKYWDNPDTESIADYLNMRRKWKVPIFMGEAGENNKDWYAGAFRLCEDHRISWSFWTWKKMQTDNSPCSVSMPAGWKQLADLQEGDPGPRSEVGERILWQFLANISLGRCVYHPEVVRSIFRRPPVRVPAVFYGYGGEGTDFGVTKRTDRPGGLRFRDGTDIRSLAGACATPSFRHGQGEDWKPHERLCVQLEQGDWLSYHVDVEPSARRSTCTVSLRICAPLGKGRILVTMDGTTVGEAEANQNAWETVLVPGEVSLDAGRHRIILEARGARVRVEWLEIQRSAEE